MQMFGGIVMELSISLITQIGSLFILIGIGYILVKKNVLAISDAAALSKLTLYVCAPAAIIKSFQIELTSERLYGFMLAIIAAIIIHIGYIVFSEILAKFFSLNDIEKVSITYSNCGNLIIPLVLSVLGEKMVFYASAYMMVQTILLWTHCKMTISREKEISIQKILGNVNMLAIALGILLCVFHIQLPVLLSSALSGAQAPLGPLSMLVVGMLLTEMSLKEVFSNKRAYLTAFFRLIAYPLVTMLVIYLSGVYKLFPSASAVLMITMLSASAPSASSITQFATIYDNHPAFSSVINTITVLLCIITMPLLNFIYTSLVRL